MVLEVPQAWIALKPWNFVRGSTLWHASGQRGLCCQSYQAQHPSHAQHVLFLMRANDCKLVLVRLACFNLSKIAYCEVVWKPAATTGSYKSLTRCGSNHISAYHPAAPLRASPVMQAWLCIQVDCPWTDSSPASATRVLGFLVYTSRLSSIYF